MTTEAVVQIGGPYGKLDIQLCPDIKDANVVYIYVSPKELLLNPKEICVQDIQELQTSIHKWRPLFEVGLIANNTISAKVISDVVNC